MRVAVVGHVEWIRFARVAHHPASGEIVHSTEDWEQAGGGGAAAALQLALLADEAHLFTSLGDDELGRMSRAELEERGVRVHAGTDRRPTRWAFTHVDETGERTITTVGPKLRPRGGDESLPWHELAEMDAVLFIAGDVEALRLARRAPVLTATARDLDVLRRGAVELEALIGSGEDESEIYHPGDLDPEPAARRHHLGRARWLDAAGRAVQRSAAARPARGCLRLRRLLHGGAHVCARGRPRPARGGALRRPLRRGGDDGPRCRRRSRSSSDAEAPDAQAPASTFS